MHITSIDNIRFAHNGKTTTARCSVKYSTGERIEFRGTARRHPLDDNVSEIGENLAFDRALEQARAYIEQKKSPWEKAGGLQSGDLIVVEPLDEKNSDWLDFGVVVNGTIIYKQGGWDFVSTFAGGGTNYVKIAYIFRPSKELNMGLDTLKAMYTSSLEGHPWQVVSGTIYT